MSRRIEFQTTAWLTAYTDADVLQSGDAERLAAALSFCHHDMRDMGWSRVGVASITIDANDEKEMIASAVESLRAEIQKTRVDAELKCRDLDVKLRQLLAIEYSGANDA